jgi:hypothetical protein
MVKLLLKNNSPFNHVQEGGGCEEYCRWPTSPP